MKFRRHPEIQLAAIWLCRLYAISLTTLLKYSAICWVIVSVLIVALYLFLDGKDTKKKWNKKRLK